MSQASDNLISALAKLAIDAQVKRSAHAAHDAAALTFANSLAAVDQAVAAVTAEVEQIAADAQKPAEAPTPEEPLNSPAPQSA